MQIHITGKERKFFQFFPVPEEFIDNIRRAITHATNIIRTCKACKKRGSDRVGLEQAFKDLKKKGCIRSGPPEISLDDLLTNVIISWSNREGVFAEVRPCLSRWEIAFTEKGARQQPLHMAGTIIHEMAHLYTWDTDPTSHQAESVLNQCCKLAPVYKRGLLGKAYGYPNMQIS